MTSKDVIKNTLQMSNDVLMAYLGDLSDEELMLRPVPGSNHIAWQLGHITSSEHQMMTEVSFPMPDLSDGFEACYTKETSTSDDAAKFHKKDQYLALMAEQRKSTLASLEAASDADLGRATPVSMHEYAKTVGEAFNLIGVHALMHAGQFAVVRRKLGKPITI